MKSYWISLYLKVENQDNLKKYAEVVTPIIKSLSLIHISEPTRQAESRMPSSA